MHLAKGGAQLRPQFTPLDASPLTDASHLRGPFTATDHMACAKIAFDCIGGTINANGYIYSVLHTKHTHQLRNCIPPSLCSFIPAALCKVAAPEIPPLPRAITQLRN